MKTAVIRVCLGADGVTIFPQLGAFEVHGFGGKVQFLPRELLDKVELDFEFPCEGKTGPAGPGSDETGG